MIKLSQYLVLSFFLLFSAACDKDDVVIVDPIIEEMPLEINWRSAENAVITQSILNEIVKIIFYNAVQSPELNIVNSEPSATTRSCTEEFVQPISNNGWFPKIYALEFEPDCDFYGSMISGYIKARLSASLDDESMNLEIKELNDFVLNGCLVKMNDNALLLAVAKSTLDGSKKFDITTNNLSIFPPDGREIRIGQTWSQVTINEMGTFFEDEGDAAFLDDLMEVSIFNAPTEEGETSFNAKTITGFPLIYDATCRWITGGQMQLDEVVASGDPLVGTKILDFGYGAPCDNLVLAAVDEESEILECP